MKEISDFVPLPVKSFIFPFVCFSGAHYMVGFPGGRYIVFFDMEDFASYLGCVDTCPFEQFLYTGLLRIKPKVPILMSYSPCSLNF